MKHLLLILLSIPFVAGAQETDTLKYKLFMSDSAAINIRPALSYNDVFYIGGGYDTARVVMLVCDTASKDVYSLFDIDPYMRFVYWQVGYSISRRGAIMCCFEYLDDKKKPLPKNIIVWMSKEL